MKKMLLAVLSLISITCFSQTTGHLRFDTVRIYKVGGNSTLAIENATRDSLGFLYNYGNGRTRFEVIRSVPGGIKVGDDTIIVNTACEDGVVFGRTVTWEGGFRFHVQEGIVSIGCQLYDLDSITLTLDSSDSDDRFDVIYDDVDGAHVLEGTPATPANIPQVTGEQIHLTAILVEAGALNPSVSSVNVYFENDATITPTGTTAVGNSTVDPFAGSFNIRITTINNGDIVDIIKPSGTWDISDQDALVLHVKNRAVVPQLANLRISLWNGSSTGSQVSSEIILAYNKNLTSGYQAIAIPMANFNVTNTNIDRVRLRFTSNNANNFTGYDIDNVFFEDGVPQPGNGGTGQFTLNLPTFLSITPSNTILTDNTTYTITANGTTAQYVRGDGSLATFSAVTGVGTFNSQTASNNGAEVSGTNIFFHPVSATVNGMATPAMKEKWDSIYYAENMSSLGDSIMVSIAVDRIGFKSLVEGAGITITPTDSTLVIAASGGSGGRFGVSGEDDAAAEPRNFNLGEFSFIMEGEGDEDDIIEIRRTDFEEAATMEIMLTPIVLSLRNIDFGDTTQIQVTSPGGGIILKDWDSRFVVDSLMDDPTATKAVVYNTASRRLFTQDISGLGGGGGGATTALDNLASVAINTSLVSDANNTDDLGSAANSWKDGYFRRILLDGSTSGTPIIESDALGNALNTTTLSGKGYGVGTMISRLTGDFTMVNGTGEQPVFGTAQDVWTLQGATTYYFEGFYNFTHNATSHSIAMSFPVGGGGSITSIAYTSVAWITGFGTTTATQTTTAINVTTAVVVNQAGSNATESVRFWGTISMNAGGTVTPSLTYSADPGGTILAKTGSYITFTPIGTNTISTLGNVN